MISIHIEQFIYTRVEAQYSPKRSSGYQMVYASKMLSQSDSDFIAGRIQCFQPRLPTTRDQYFTLPSGQIVLTHTVDIPAPSHREIIDKDGRGAFLTHGLVFSSSDFLKMSNNPFAILNHFEFVENAEEMVARFGRGGEIQPEILTIDSTQYPANTEWTANDAERLLELTWQEQQPLLLSGTQAEIHETLQLILAILPPDKRVGMYFDSCIDRCLVQQEWYRIVGSSQSQSGYLSINIASRRISSSNPPLPDDLYIQWFQFAQANQNLETIIRKAPTVQSLAHAFQHQQSIHSSNPDSEACQEFFTLHQQLITQRLQSAFEIQAGIDLASQLNQFYLRGATSQALLRLLETAALGQLTDRECAELTANWIVANKPNLTTFNLKQVEGLARATEHHLLLYFSAVLGKTVKPKVRNEALERMNEEMFVQAMALLMNPISVEHFVTRKHINTLLADDRLQEMSDEVFVQLVKTIVDMGLERHLHALEWRIATVSNQPLTQIEKAIKNHETTSPQFASAVQTRREALGEHGFFRQLWKKS